MIAALFNLGLLMVFWIMLTVMRGCVVWGLWNGLVQLAWTQAPAMTAAQSLVIGVLWTMARPLVSLTKGGQNNAW